MSRMISNCPVKKPNMNFNSGGVFNRNNVPDNRKNQENRKLTKKQPYFLKLYNKSRPNKPNKMIR